MPTPIKQGKLFMKDASGSLVQIIPQANVTVPSYTGATSSAAGSAGLVPAAQSSEREKFLRGDGTWQEASGGTSVPYQGATASANGVAGLVPAATIAEKDNYLKGDGTWGTIVDVTAVHKTGDEVIDGLKCFTLSSAGGPSGLQMVATDSSVTRYGTPSSDKFLSTCYWSSDALTNQITAANYTSYLLGCIEYASRSDGGRDIKLLCTKPDNSTVAYNSLMLGYDANGVSYAQAPSTSTTRTAGKDIVTRDFIPSDTRIVHTSGNETIAGTKTFSSTISGTADKANKDGSGNVITTTYATKSEIPSSYQGATSSADGVAGLVPAATSANRDKFLKADGTWAEVSTAKEVASMTSEPTAQNTTTLDNGSLIFYDIGSSATAVQPVFTTGNQTVQGVKTFTAGVFGGKQTVSGNSFDCSAATCFTKTLSGNVTFSFTNVPEDAVCCITVILVNGGNYTVTWPASVKWTKNLPPDLTENGTDVVTFITATGGNVWYGTATCLGVTA